MSEPASDILSSDFLYAKKWEKIYGELYEVWRKGRWLESSAETQTYLNHHIPLGRKDDSRQLLLPHSAEAVQRVIYSYEQQHIRDLLVTMAHQLYVYKYLP